MGQFNSLSRFDLYSHTSTIPKVIIGAFEEEIIPKKTHKNICIVLVENVKEEQKLEIVVNSAVEFLISTPMWSQKLKLLVRSI